MTSIHIVTLYRRTDPDPWWRHKPALFIWSKIFTFNCCQMNSLLKVTKQLMEIKMTNHSSFIRPQSSFLNFFALHSLLVLCGRGLRRWPPWCCSRSVEGRAGEVGCPWSVLSADTEWCPTVPTACSARTQCQSAMYTMSTFIVLSLQYLTPAYPVCKYWIVTGF